MASSSESNTVYLSWPAILSHPLAPLQNLNLLYRNVSDNSEALLVMPLDLQIQTLTVDGLEPSTLYGFMLQAKNAHGAEMTREVTIGTGPAKMGSLFLMPNALVTPYLIMLSWTA